MRGKRLEAFVLSVCLCILLFGCGDKNYGDSKATRRRLASNRSTKSELKTEYEENYNNYMVATGEASELMLVYMVGSNLESEAGLASEDIEEMQKCGFLNENIKIVICTGGANYWWNDEISKDEVAIYEVNSGTDKLNKLTVLNNDNMAEADTLTAFLDYAYDNYEANYYSLVLWNHGGGAVLGYGGDERYDYDTLSMSEMDEAFSNSHIVNDGRKFEWVGFDACLMGMIEVAELLTPYSNYLIASEEVIPGEGWDYTCLKKLSDGTDFSGVNAGQIIIDKYADYYDNYEWYSPEYTLSCMDLSQTKTVMDAFDLLISVTENDLINGEYSNIARQRGNTKSFGIVNEDLCYDTVDLFNLSENMSEAHPGEASALQNALNDMVIYERSNVENTHGVAIYFPYNNKLYAEEWVDEYSLNDFSETYMQFVKNFTETFNGAPLTVWDISGDDASVDLASDDNTSPDDLGEDTAGDDMAAESENEIGNLGSLGSFLIQLSDEQAANFASAKLAIWEIYENSDEGGYGLWIDSSDVNLSSDNVLSSGIINKRIVLKDTAGNQADCCATEIERGDGYAVYKSSVFVSFLDDNGEYDLDRSFIPYDIHIRIDSANPNGVITGIYPFENEDNSSLLPEKTSVTFDQGCLIEPFSFGRIIEFNDDGTVKPFDEWENYSGVFYGFSLEGDLMVDMVDIDPDIEKVYVYSIKDTQGNEYQINVIQ
ncbi:MAG: hypothetical protein IJ141_01815 [Lachnospiraceae bacterium]|nr:hypothetical protein [Lachnospiraceae bacterium]